MDETITKLRILASAEINLARIKSRRLAGRAGLFGIAGGLLLLALVMVNIGAYHLLADQYSPSVSAFLVAAGNALLAVILVLAGLAIRAGAEEKLAREIREMALDELAADADQLRDDLSHIGRDVKRIRSGFSILTKGGRIGANLASLAPLFATIIEAVKRHRSEKKAQAESGEAGAPSE